MYGDHAFSEYLNLYILSNTLEHFTHEHTNIIYIYIYIYTHTCTLTLTHISHAYKHVYVNISLNSLSQIYGWFVYDDSVM